MELRSWGASGRGEVASGEAELSEFEAVLSVCDSKLVVLLCVGGAGGARLFPLPSILPPPSFLAAMAGDDTVSRTLSVKLLLCMELRGFAALDQLLRRWSISKQGYRYRRRPQNRRRILFLSNNTSLWPHPNIRKWKVVAL